MCESCDFFCILVNNKLMIHFWKKMLFDLGIWNSRVKTIYGLWFHKTELRQIVTSKLIFRNLETLQWKNENKKAELSNSKILLDKKISSYVTQVFYFLFFYFKISELCNSEVLFSLNTSPKPYRPSNTIFWTKLGSKNKNIYHLRDFNDAFLKNGF